MTALDPTSVSNIEYFTALHLDWDIKVDFTGQIMNCVATQKFLCEKDGSTSLVLDTRNLKVVNVKVDDTDANFEFLEEVVHLGQPLKIQLPTEKCSKSAEFTVCIEYETSPSATAIQWLKPEQTSGKKHPYLFTQCQAIHARSLLPCQDSPGNKITYTANITVPADMVALMSALQSGQKLLENGSITYQFNQKVKIPSYLLAIAIGAMEYRDIGPRSKVWCEKITPAPGEKSWVEKCQEEFNQVEEMIQTGESFMGEYVWGQYDLLILPPSFPYGGMENPCLTFVTPTVVAGDKSLVSVIAHEITHSWTGNLVTNQNWEHFWLNEGFTRFIEGKIMEKLETNSTGSEQRGKEMRDFMAIGSWQKLQDAVNRFHKEDNDKFSHLVPSLLGEDPDDAFSSVPYEKGYSFLYYIESLVGGPQIFNPFLKSYIQKYQYKKLVTEDFKNYLLEYFQDKADVLKLINWDAWLHQPGMPPENVNEMYDDSYAKACQALADRWVNADEDTVFEKKEFDELITLQKIDFLTKLYQCAVKDASKTLSLPMTLKLAKDYDLRSNNNAEIKFCFLRLSIRAEYEEVVRDDVIKFITGQGRMKFVRPLYREMYASTAFKDLARETFIKHRDFYHSIAATMISRDLGLE